MKVSSHDTLPKVKGDPDLWGRDPHSPLTRTRVRHIPVTVNVNLS